MDLEVIHPYFTIMRRYLLILTLMLTGCGSKSQDSQTHYSSSPTNKEESLVTAPVDYIASSIRIGENTKGTIELVTLRKAIESFQQQEERNPDSLEELVQKSYLKVLPTPPSGLKFEYNPKTGDVRLIPKS